MTPQELKNSILQLAIQGKLVEQRSEEGTGRELLEGILAAKNAEGAKGKGEKSHAKSAKSAKCSGSQFSPISDDEKPFDIPDSWEWVRLGAIGFWSAGATPLRTQPDYYGGNIPWLKTGDLNDGYVTKIPETITEIALEKTSVRLNPVGSVLMAMYGATIGKLGILKIPATTNQACCACIPCKWIYNEYLFYFLRANRSVFIKMGEGGAQPNISKEKIVKTLIPLPPLAEQKRIVAKIEELMPLIDRYEKAWSRLESFNKSFPVDMQKSILQMAIQGKLVEQRAEEGTGRELLEKILAAKNAESAKGNGKGRLTRSRGDRGDAPTSAPSPLPGHPLRGQPSAGGYSSPRDEIPDDEKPFDIPDSWEWVRLGELVFNHGQKKPTDDFSYIDIGSIDNRRQKLSSSETIIHPQDASPRARKIVFKGDVLYATVRPYLHNICIIDREFSCEPIASTGFAVMACTPCLDNKFLFYFLLSPDFDRYANSSENAKGVAYPAISDKRLYGALIPLPPLAEQKRIVAKIEELLPLCDRLK